MNTLDWVVLLATIAIIVVWGTLRYRGEKTAVGYMRGGDSLSWPTIGLAVMATQASAVTFLSVPGQAYEDGLRFVQFYFGMPLAIIVVAAVFVPIYYRLKVFTAYEYLEQRFDLKTRLLGAAFFLLSRGLQAGITIYAPGILLSSIFGWQLEVTNVAIGAVVIVYTVAGGSKAVAQSQKQQMVIVLLGLVAAGVAAVLALPDNVDVDDALGLAGALGRMNAIDTTFDLESRYNIWSGLIGGFFLSLAYFGTDQSQVGRYLGARSVTASRLGLLFNGLFKIPMQAGILLVGVLVFAVYIFAKPPVFWNQPALEAAMRSEQAPALAAVTKTWDDAFEARREAATNWVMASDEARPAAAAALVEADTRMVRIREDARKIIAAAVPGTEKKDSDYIFLGFALDFLPAGLLGLLVAVILSAAMSSIAGELSALGTTTALDFFKRLRNKPSNDWETIAAARWFTVLWGVVAIAFATFAAMLDNLIQAVNIIGSLLYGTVLGLFVVAFALRKVRGTAVFWAAVVGEAVVVGSWALSDIGFLWYNVIGCAVVVVLAPVLQVVFPGDRTTSA
jgi:SSS family transporter